MLLYTIQIRLIHLYKLEQQVEKKKKKHNKKHIYRDSAPFTSRTSLSSTYELPKKDAHC